MRFFRASNPYDVPHTKSCYAWAEPIKIGYWRPVPEKIGIVCWGTLDLFRTQRIGSW